MCLLARATCMVEPTHHGECLPRLMARYIDGIDARLTLPRKIRDRPAGSNLVTANEDATWTVLYWVMAALVTAWLDIQVKVCVDNGFADIVIGRFDMGIGSVSGLSGIRLRCGARRTCACLSSVSLRRGRAG